MKRAFILVIVAAGFGCGSSDSGSIPGGGSVATQLAFIAQPTTCAEQGVSFSVSAVVVGQSDRSISNACSAVNACTNYKNMNTVGISVFNFTTTGTATAVGTGTYNVGTPSSASGTFASFSINKSDANCVDTGTEANSGTVTLTKVGSTVEGSYDVTMPDGSKKSGSFSATACSSNPFTADICGSGANGCTGTPTCN